MTAHISFSASLAMVCAFGLAAIQSAAGAMLDETRTPMILYTFGSDSPDYSSQTQVDGLEPGEISDEAGSMSAFSYSPLFSDYVAYASGWDDPGNAFYFIVTVRDGYIFTATGWSEVGMRSSPAPSYFHMSVDRLGSVDQHEEFVPDWGKFNFSDNQKHAYSSFDDEDGDVMPLTLPAGRYYFRFKPSGFSAGYFMDELAIYGTMSSITVNPEPSTAACVGLGLAIFLIRRRGEVSRRLQATRE